MVTIVLPCGGQLAGRQRVRVSWKNACQPITVVYWIWEPIRLHKTVARPGTRGPDRHAHTVYII